MDYLRQSQSMRESHDASAAGHNTSRSELVQLFRYTNISHDYLRLCNDVTEATFIFVVAGCLLAATAVRERDAVCSCFSTGNIPDDQRVLDPRMGPIRKTAAVKTLPRLWHCYSPSQRPLNSCQLYHRKPGETLRNHLLSSLSTLCTCSYCTRACMGNINRESCLWCIIVGSHGKII